MVPMTYLSLLEAPVGILALSSPSIGQLVARAAKHRSLASLFSSTYRSNDSGQSSDYSTGKKSLKDSSYSELGPSSRNRWYPGRSHDESHSTTAIAQRTSNDDDPEIPMKAINVSHDVEVTRHKAGEFM
jgi:hypothetical protein